MAGADATLVLKVVADTKQASGEVANTQRQVGGLGGTLRGIATAVPIAFAAGAVVSFGKDVAGAASEAEQAAGAVETVFGDAADEVMAMGEQAAEGAGLAAAEYGNLAAAVGTQLKAKGIENVADQTDDLIGLGADLAATYGGTTTDAVSALGATLRGEFDSAEKFGLSLSAASVAAKAVEMGLAESTSAVDDQAKAQATLALITEQTTDAQGAFARESDTVAGSAAIMSAKWDNVKTQLGKFLLPVIAKVITAISDMIDLVVKYVPEIWKTIKPVVTMVGKIFKTVFSAVVEVVKAWWRYISAYVKMVIDIFRGIIRFVTAVFRGDWKAAFQAIKDIFKAIWDGIKAMVRALTDPFRIVLDWLRNTFKGSWKSIFDSVKTVFKNIWDGIKTAIEELPGVLAGIVSGLLTAAKNAGGAIVDGILSGLGAAGGAVWAFAQDIGRAFKDFINDNVIAPVKGFTFSINIGPIDKTFQPFGSLPYLAKGGIVTGPTIAMLGEAGPEAVVPLDRGGFGNTYTITVNAGVGDPVRIGHEVVTAITAYERVNGRRWRTANVG